MLPLLAPGDEVLVDPRASIRPGHIVVARHPYRSDLLLVKYLVAFDEAGRAQLEGLNPEESTDSRTQGNVPRALLLGKVTSRFPTHAQ
jgi:nickel-type superoxide dismutase maturation protease